MNSVRKCGNCGEQILDPGGIDSTAVHLYNFSVKCPDGSGMIKVGLGDAKGDELRKQERVEELSQKLLEEMAKAKAQAEKEQDDEEGKSEGGGKTKSKAPKSAPKKEDQDSDGSGEGQMSDKDAWAIPAAQDVNRIWRDRVRVRGYEPTDEELAQIMLRHSAGKVEYRSFEEKIKAKQKKQEDALTLTEKDAAAIQNLLLEVFTINNTFQRYGGTSITVQNKQQLGKYIKGLVVCVHCGAEDMGSLCVKSADGHKWRAKFMVGQLEGANTYSVWVRTPTSLRLCSGFCLHCNLPIYGSGNNLKHATDDTAHCVVGKRAVRIGGTPTVPIEKGTPYVYRVWKDNSPYAYAPIIGDCPLCSDQLYQEVGSTYTYHVRTGDGRCRKEKLDDVYREE
jgi:hypothetical protein